MPRTRWAASSYKDEFEVLHKPYDRSALAVALRAALQGGLRAGATSPGEDIADAAHGLDQLRALAAFDLLAQARNEPVDRAVERRPVVPLQEVHELVAREHAPRALDEDGEQVELGRRQLAQVALRAS